MSRLQRKKRPDIDDCTYMSNGGLDVIIDAVFRTTWIVNDKEMDWMCDKATDEELGYLVLSEKPTYGEIKKGLMTADNLLKRMYDER